MRTEFNIQPESFAFKSARDEGELARARSLGSSVPRGPSVPAASSAPPSSSGLGARAAAIATQEWNRWNQGAIKESSPRMRSVLEDYWKAGAGWLPSEPEWWSRKPWSAAFISWVMKKAGAGKTFKYAAAHAV